MRGLPILVALLLLAPHAAAEAPFRLGPPAEAPKRIVTLAPSITELVVDLGAGERLVGVSRYDDLPEVAALPRVGGFLDPSPEAILALRPELLVVQPSPGNRGVVERLAALGVPVLALPMHTVGEVLASIRATGEALGTAEQGDALASRIEAAIARVRAETASLPKRRAIVVYSWSPLVAAGPGSFPHELLAAAGGENVVGEAAVPFPTLSAEAALAAAPQVIVDASGGHGAGRPLPGWEARARRPRSAALYRPGPRLLEALRELRALLHPEGAE